MEQIYRCYADTQIYALETQITCPHCSHEWYEVNMDECGQTYKLVCEECEREFEMFFDVD